MPPFPLFLLVPLFSRFSPFPCSFCLHFLLCCPVFLVPPVPLFTLFPCSPCSPGLLFSLFPLFPSLPLFSLVGLFPLCPLFFLLPCSSSSPVSLSRLNPLFHFFPCSPCSPHPFPPCFPFSFCFPLSPDSPCSPVLYVAPFPCSTVPCSSVSLSKSKGYTISVNLCQTRYWASMLWSVDSFQKRAIRRAPQDCIEVRCTAH